jgi:hypothetical protein
MPTPEAVRAALAPLCGTIAALDLTDPEGARRSLSEVHPLWSLSEVRSLLFAARDEGWLTPRRATDTLTYGRLAKAAPETSGISIDIVDMAGAGAEHVHPNGEVNLCFKEEGDPRFCGSPEGWYVVAPQSRHVPTVTDGRMLIAYFLPQGAIQFV